MYVNFEARNPIEAKAAVCDAARNAFLDYQHDAVVLDGRRVGLISDGIHQNYVEFRSSSNGRFYVIETVRGDLPPERTGLFANALLNMIKN